MVPVKNSARNGQPVQVNSDLTEQAATFGLILEDKSLTFGKEFTEAEKVKQVTEICGWKGWAAIISAEGDSRAAELLHNSLATSGDGLIELQGAEGIDGHLPHSWNITYLAAGTVSDPLTSPVRPPLFVPSQANQAMTLIIPNEVFRLSHSKITLDP